MRQNRKVSFEDVVEIINKNKVIKFIDNPNQKRYPNQRLIIVKIRKYIYVVPFLETDTEVFLKTIYPSRKFMKMLKVNSNKYKKNKKD